MTSQKSALVFFDRTFPGLVGTSSGKKKKVIWNLICETENVKISCLPRKKHGELSRDKNKQKQMIWCTIPFELVWVRESQLQKNEEDDLIKRANAFELVVPNKILILGTPSLEDREHWIVELRKLINRRLEELGMAPNCETRKAVYTFAGVGSYDGTWLRGQMHGEGTFTSIENIIYRGHWHSVMKAGFGQIQEVSVHDNVGWEYSAPFTGIVSTTGIVEESRKKSKIHIEGEHFEEEFTKEDIELFINSKHVELHHYYKGTVILKEGERSNHVYRIKTGEIHAIKTIRGEKVISEIFKPASIFGEMSIFDQATNITFIAATDSEVYLAEIAELYRSFCLHHELSKSFNFQIAKNFAFRLLHWQPEKDCGVEESEELSCETTSSKSPRETEEELRRGNRVSSQSEGSHEREMISFEENRKNELDFGILEKCKIFPVHGVPDSFGTQVLKEQELKESPRKRGIEISAGKEFSGEILIKDSEKKEKNSAKGIVESPRSGREKNMKEKVPTIRNAKSSSEINKYLTIKETNLEIPGLIDLSKIQKDGNPVHEKTEKGNFFSDFPIWSSDTWPEIVSAFSEDVVYRDPIVGEITGKKSISGHQRIIRTTWQSWNWKIEKSITNGPTTVHTGTLRFHSATTSRIVTEPVAIWVETNDKDQIFRFEVFFDATRIRGKTEKRIKRCSSSISEPQVLRRKTEELGKYEDVGGLARPRSRSLKEAKSSISVRSPLLESSELDSEERVITRPRSRSSVQRDKGTEIVLKQPRFRSVSTANMVANITPATSTLASMSLSSASSSATASMTSSVTTLAAKPTLSPSREKEGEKTKIRKIEDNTIIPLEEKIPRIRRRKGEKTETPGSSPMTEKLKIGNPSKIKRPYTVTSQPTRTKSISGGMMDSKEIKKKEATSPRMIATLNPAKMYRDKAALKKELANKEREKEEGRSWFEKFDIPEVDKNDAIIREFRCQLTVGAKLPSFSTTRRNGTLYISSKYICYFCGFFGMNTKEVIPIKVIDRLRLREFENTIGVKISKKRMLRVKSKFVANYSRATITFFTYNECAEAGLIIEKLWAENREKDDENEVGESPRVSESMILRTISTSTLDTTIPNIELSYSKFSPAIRLSGPEGDDEPPTTFGNDVCALSISTYPRIATIGSDGSVTVHPTRQGDPICDQYCLERYENRTIFAVADGCNWGVKVRNAAKLAARTFVDYNKRVIFDQETTQAVLRSFMQSFVHVHHRILEGHEETWWECGTTTLLGGSILEINDPLHKWALVCLSIGDCKAYHISLKNNNKKIGTVTQGSRTGTGTLDARDCGGRLGPHKKTDPDLRNLSAFFQYVEEGDFVVVVSDGIYDNLDPQSLGIELSSSGICGFEQKTWKDLTESTETHILEDVEQYKSDYTISMLGKLIDEILSENSLKPHEIQCSHIAGKLIEHSLRTTKATREYMEKFPNVPQPANYTEFPGKVDHATCVVIKVGRTNFRKLEVDLRDLVVRLRHPTYGVTKEAEGTQTGTFKGTDLVRWLAKDPEYSEMSVNFSQALVNFNYIGPVTASDSFIYETFNPELLYQFKVFVPIMTHRDWKIILQGTIRRTYVRGDVIIREGTEQEQIYQLTFGTCHVERKVPVNVEYKLRLARESITKPNSPRPSIKEKPQIQYLGTIGPPQTFGEISLLTGQRASATVIVDSNEVEVLVLERNFINIMFVRYPDMAGRFYHYLASVLARRLGFHEAGADAKSEDI